MGINKGTCATSSTLGYEQGEQLNVTTKLSTPIRGRTCLKLLPSLLLVVTIDVTFEVTIEHATTPSLMVISKVEPLKFVSIVIPLTPL
jgi:hypothetical protein